MVSFNNQRFQEKPEHTRKPGRKAGLQAVPDGKEEPDDRPEDVDHSYTGVHPLLAPLHHLRYMVKPVYAATILFFIILTMQLQFQVCVSTGKNRS